MSGPAAIIGFAIVSEDGMLAGADGVMPDALKLDADQKYFADGMDRVQVSIHGRHSQEQQPHSHLRYHITVTTRVGSVAPDAENPKGILWNPAGASLAQAWATLGLSADAKLGIVGGTDVFGLFLDDYDEFHLSRTRGVRLPGGRPVFPGVPQFTPEQILQKHGLVSGAPQTLDAAKGVTVTVWRRA